jgi:uncharacterized small protein (DUF1192 family)
MERSKIIYPAVALCYAAVNIGDTIMDLDDILPRKKDDALHSLISQDLDRLSVDELSERIELLEAEVARCKAKRDGATKFRTAADSLFKK